MNMNIKGNDTNEKQLKVRSIINDIMFNYNFFKKTTKNNIFGHSLIKFYHWCRCRNRHLVMLRVNKFDDIDIWIRD